MFSKVFSAFFLLLTITTFGQETKFKILNTSVNSEYAELGTKFLNDQTVIYASSKKVEEDQAFIKSRRRRQRQLSLAIYSAQITDNGELVHNGRYFSQTQDYIEMTDFSITPDGKTIYFIWNNYFPHMNDSPPNNWSNLRIMKGIINAENEIDISNVQHLPFINDKNNYQHVVLSSDGKTLYFSSDLPRGSGGMDIYKVDILPDGTYSEPENLGTTINSSQDEIFPFVDASNSLYFSSYGHGSRGGLDIFKSKSVNGKFSNVEQMDAPINSGADDFGFIINPMTQKGYFTSNRGGGMGDIDIYAFEPDIPDCSQIFAATFFNSKTSEQLRNLQVTLIDENGEIINSIFVSELTATSLPLTCESNFTVRIEKEGYETMETRIQTSKEYDVKLNREFQLVEIPCTQFIAGEIFHKLDLSPLNDVLLKIMSNDKLFTEQLVSGTNSFNIEVPCNAEYAITASKDGFETINLNIQTGSKFKETVSKNVLLAPRICAQAINVAVSNAETSSEVTRFKARLLANGTLIDEKSIINGNEFNFNLNCDESYVIEVEKEGFELETFTIATNNSYDIQHKKEVSLEPIPCVQFALLKGVTERDTDALAIATINIFSDDNLIGTSNSPLNKIQLPCQSNISLEITSPGYVTKTVQIKTSETQEYTHERRISLEPFVCEQILTLKVADIQTKTGLTSFMIEINDGESTMSKNIRNGSTAILRLRCDTNYNLSVIQNDYEKFDFPINTTSAHEENLSKTVFLTPLVCEQIISGKIVDAENGTALTKALVTISSGNAFSQTLSLDSNGFFNFKGACETTYKLSASLLNYGSEELLITTTNKRGAYIQKTIELQRDLEFTIAAGQRMINTNNIVFELNKIEVTTETAIELNKVVALLNKYPNLKLLVKSHTDSRAPDQLNLTLTEGRAQNIREYIVSKGIDGSRVTAKGMGETELLNNCANGVKCTDEEHAINRRTEFIVSN